jgi:mannonate dehydratase
MSRFLSEGYNPGLQQTIVINGGLAFCTRRESLLLPWSAEELCGWVDKLKAGGLALGNLMIYGFPKPIYGKPGRDEEIEKITQSIEAAGKAGILVIEYNFYAHRAMEGYFEQTGRGGAGLTGADYDRMKDLPPLPEEGTHTLTEMWENLSHFLKAVVPRGGEGERAVGAAPQ